MKQSKFDVNDKEHNMTLINRLSGTLIGCAALLLGSTAALAESYPNKEVTLLVNYGAGGGVDRTARSIQPFLPKALGQNVIVENIGGAGGKTGMKAFMARDADGYTVLTAFAPATTYGKFTTPGLFEMADLSVINVQWIDPAILLANKTTGWNSLADMVAYAKENPGKVTFSSSGKGSVGPILARALFRALDIKIKMVPYKGGGAARKAFAAGEVQLTAAGAGGAARVKDKAIALGLFSEPNTSADWPNAPSINAQLKRMNVTVPEGGAYRFFAVHSDVKKNHPERYETLVNAFEDTVTRNQEFLDTAAKSKVGTDWFGPKASQALIEKIDAEFTYILKSE